jgi:hypothetical protein
LGVCTFNKWLLLWRTLDAKNLDNRVSESINPEFQKTYGEQAKESVTDGIDKMKWNMMPDTEKSAHQSSSDSVNGKSGQRGQGLPSVCQGEDGHELNKCLCSHLDEAISTDLEKCLY